MTVDIRLRPATPEDAAHLGALHGARISEGFLPTLGPRFLALLYRRIARSPHAFALAAVRDGEVVGFAAAATDLGALYREFLLRDGVRAGLAAAPRLLRSWRKVLETLRYPAAGAALPDAEILAVAVAPGAAGQGVGRTLVDGAVAELRRRGIDAVKVVAGADNAAALALYRACGFTTGERRSVHEGTTSEVLVWSSS